MTDAQTLLFAYSRRYLPPKSFFRHHFKGEALNISTKAKDALRTLADAGDWVRLDRRQGDALTRRSFAVSRPVRTYYADPNSCFEYKITGRGRDAIRRGTTYDADH